MKVKCSLCGAGISKPRNRVKEDERHFCNNECRSRYHDEKNRSKKEKLQLIVDYIDDCENATKRELREQLEINKHNLKNYLLQLRDANKVVLERNGSHSWLYKLKFRNVTLKNL